jgi:outer membrane protein TolC
MRFKSFYILVILAIVLKPFTAQAYENKTAAVQEITLKSGIEIILKDNWLVKIAGDQNALVAAQALMARSALMPQVNAQVTQTFLSDQPRAKFGPEIVSTSNRDYYSYGFDVYQTLFDFGRTIFTYRAAQEMIEAYRANKEAVTRVAVLEFISAYFDFLEAQKMILVAEKEVETITSYLKDTQRLYEAGAAVKSDVLPVKVRLALAWQKLIAARNDKNLTLARIKNILAIPLNVKIEVKESVMPNLNIVPLPLAWDKALTSRPELTFFDHSIGASNFSARAKTVDDYLTIFADGGYNRTRNQYVQKDDSFFLNIGAKANLFDGGLSRARMREEKELTHQLQDQKDKLIEDIQFEVENSSLQLNNSLEEAIVAKSALDQARENVRVNRRKYAAGSATTTEVLEAITLDTQAHTDYYRALYETRRGYARFFYAIGTELAPLYGAEIKEAYGTKERKK